MILHRLTLKDFGLFSGEQTFRLTPRIKYTKRRPIILIGGKNGTGKTTILEAVRLCMYGARSLGNRVSRKEYHEYLASTVHHSQATLLKPKEASVALEFEYAHSGENNAYYVKRQWEIRQSIKEPIGESLIIHKDNEPLADFEAEHWQDILNELIPIGLSQLFFFDGEKIQGLAEDASSPVFLADSIKSLLGVDLVERLQSDLKIYLNRSKVKEANSDQLTEAINSTERKCRDLEAELNRGAEKKTGLEAQIVEIETQIAQQEEQITREGGGYARKRENLKMREAKLNQKISDLEKQIRDACSGLLPFALASSLCEQLRTRLIKEAEIKEWNSVNRVLKERNRGLLEHLEGSEFWDSMQELPPESSLRESVHKGVANLLAKQLQPSESLKDLSYVHSLSPPESQQLISWIDLCLTEVPEQFRELSRQLEDSNRELQRVETDLERIPSDEVLKPLTQRLSNLHQRLGALQKELQNESSNIQSLAYRLKVVERRLDRLYESQRESQANLRRARLVSDVRLVLDKYAGHLTSTKVEALTNAVVDCFGTLCHKHNFVKRIEVNPRTFVTTLYDQQDRIMTKEHLSAGEKQIYAISMLWGLAKTSGRSLPMIIDTPLGRLDSEHRHRLIEHYFPYASHQVVVLSTDTELDKQNYEILSPHVSHAYHLVYDQLKGSTNVEERYFWRIKDSES